MAISPLRLAVALLAITYAAVTASASLAPTGLRVEYLVNQEGIEETSPRLSWKVVSAERSQKQTAYRLLVASNQKLLGAGKADLWDTGKVSSDQTVNVEYAGKPLGSRATCFWKVQVWNKDGKPSSWSEPAHWTMGLLKPDDWQGAWISFKDNSPVHADRKSLFLPPAHFYRKEFKVTGKISRATVYASALGTYELHLNGKRVGDAFFTPGWSDYLRRAYYNTFDVTRLLHKGDNAIGAIVADGWYAGYVGYGLLVGYGPNKVGRYFYGKSPALLAQLEIEYADGHRDIIGTDTTWKVTDQGPIREADFIMGETFDARRDWLAWSAPTSRTGASPVPNEPTSSASEAGGTPGLPWNWQNAIRAEDNGSTKALFSDNCGSREVELGFQKPARLQAYCAPPIRVTQELKARRITEPRPGVYVFDLGQNFAGVIRLKVKGPAGTKVQIRCGEMLHSDGRLMTENLRKARATDYYILRGDRRGESWTPRFAYHGFQYVELSGLPTRPALDAVTGLVLHSDTPLIGDFQCSDPVMTKFAQNARWTQRANFVELPTDCPQRDERLGWMGDAQLYIRTASYNADVSAFFTKWLDDVEEAQRDYGAYPDYCPYPMGHGKPGQTWGAAWTDAGIIGPWTIWQVYGDTRVIQRHWSSMTRFMDWRKQRAPDLRGRKDGNTWGDWLNLGEETPIEFIDAAYFKWDANLMAQMAEAIGRQKEAADYYDLQARIAGQFGRDYHSPDGSMTLKVNTQTAYVLALAFGLTPSLGYGQRANRLAEMITTNGCRMATGFLGTKPLLPVLTAHGHHDLAVRLFQSRQFPSWGYEVINGANSVWERWDSFTKEHGFDGQNGKQNASMNSFSHYSFGAVMEWAYSRLAGIDTDGPGFKKIVICPGPPAPGSNPANKPIDWVKAEYGSIHGKIVSQWKRGSGLFELTVSIPANTTATVFMPTQSADAVSESGKSLLQTKGVKFLHMKGDRAVLAVDSGDYRFSSKIGR